MRRVLSVMLAVILMFGVFASTLCQHAEALAGVVVAGAVAAVMAMAGITIVASGMTAVEVQGWVEDKLDEWAADVGSPLDHLINSAGIGVTISGLMTVGTAAAQGINQFITWLKNNLGLVDNSSTNVIQVSASGMVQVPYVSSFDYSVGEVNGILYGYRVIQGDRIPYYVGHSNQNADVFIGVYAIGGGSYSVQFISDMQCYGYNFYYNTGNSVSTYVSSTINGQTFYYNTQIVTISEFEPINGVSIYGTQSDVFAAYLGRDDAQPGDQSLDLDVGVLTLPTVQNEDKVFLDVGALPGSTVTEVTSGVFTDVATDGLTVSGSVAEEEPPYIINGPVSVSGLDDIFPFCIPFDLYHMLEALAADPVAPSFEWRFYVPNLIDETVTIDLSSFNQAAQILRIMETLLFCIGLAFETRKLLRS